ncbi:hypothetical protein XENOCAPTIV_026739, partial [Xenoophorus captivus]
KVELHGKLIEVDYSVPKKLRPTPARSKMSIVHVTGRMHPIGRVYVQLLDLESLLPCNKKNGALKRNLRHVCEVHERVIRTELAPCAHVCVWRVKECTLSLNSET